MTARLDTRERRAGSTSIGFRLLAVAVAVVAPILVWIVAYVVGVDFEVTSPAIGTLTIDVPLVIVSTIPIVLAAWGLLAVLERRTTRARTTWTILAVVVLVLSIPPLALLEATVATKVALGIMHLAAAVPLILMLRHGARGT